MNILAYISYKNILYPVVSRNSESPGFFDWFSIPIEVAHLATIKEQSRHLKCVGFLGGLTSETSGLSARLMMELTTLETLLVKVTGRVAWSLSTQGITKDLSPPFFLNVGSSIKQFLKVLAMSVLTTNDLELGIMPNRIVTFRSFLKRS